MRAPIQIVDCATKELVDAELFDEVTIEHFLEAQREWRPLVVEVAKRMVKSGASRESIPRHFHWDWSTTDEEWLKKKAEQENGCYVSVGGLVQALEQTGQGASNVIPIKHAFVRFVQLARRERRLSLEQFAERVDVDLVELLKIETEEPYKPAIRTVAQDCGFPQGSRTEAHGPGRVAPGEGYAVSECCFEVRCALSAS